MGTYGKYFCMSVSDILICLGTAMALLNGLAVVFDVICFTFMLKSMQSNVGGFVSLPFISLYFVSALFHCSLCCKSSYKNTKRFFIVYIVFVSVIAACALIDGVFKLQLFFLVSLFYFLFCILNILCIIIAIMARHELLQKQQRTLDLFNTGYVNANTASCREDFPKFAMTVNVEKVETRNEAEVEPLNRINI